MAESESNVFNQEGSNQPAPDAQAEQQPQEPTTTQESSVFSKQEPKPTQQSPQVPEELQELVGEGKKYKTMEDALRSIPHAQNHIKTLEEKMQELEQEVQRRRAAEEVLEEVRKQGQEQPGATTSEANPAGEEDVQSLVRQTLERELTQREQAALVRQNQQQVVSSLSEKYGDKAEEVYVQKAQELGVPVSFLDDVAAKSPNAVLAYFGGSQQRTPAKTSSSLNTEQVARQQPQAKRKNVMFGASSSDIMDAWNSAKPQD